MNRWFVAALVTLGLIIILSPGIVGRLAEKSVENLNFAASETDEIVVTTERFERGWFTSEGRHRIELRRGVLHDVFRGKTIAADANPFLLVNTHIDHGLLPVTSLSRELSSLRPGLASTVSTIALDPGDGELIDLPGKVYSQIGLSGATASRFVLEAGSRDVENGMLEWQGADLTVTTDPANGTVSVKGVVKPWVAQYKSDDEERSSFSLGQLTIDGQQRQSAYGFAVGRIELDVGVANVDSAFATATGFQSLSIRAHSEIDDAQVNSAAKISIAGIRYPTSDNIDITLDIVVEGLDAKATNRITQVIESIQGDPDPQDALTGIYPLIETDIQKLLSSGMKVRLDQFDVTMPNGELTTKFQFNLPPTDQSSDFSWPALLLALDASADVRVPVGLFEMAQAMSPEVGMLVAMGALKRDGDVYEMRAEYAKGLVTINGAPMPIPLQALQ